MFMLSQKNSGNNKIQWVFKMCVLNINVTNFKMYFFYEIYTHLISSECFESGLISVINFYVQIPVHLKLFYAY